MILYDSEGRVWEFGKLSQAAKRGVAAFLLAFAVANYSEAQEPAAGANLGEPTGSASMAADPFSADVLKILLDKCLFRRKRSVIPIETGQQSERSDAAVSSV